MVWKGKDQQNDDDLEVQAVPIYIQEHIQPQAIIEAIRAHEQKKSDQIGNLFEGFDNLDFNQKIEFYQHEQNWHNRFILGDSLAVMNSLAEKESLKKGVQMIYFDPPYGIKFKSNWQVSTRKRDVSDTKAEDVTPQPEQIKAFRDTWKGGINSYLTYLRDRLTVARELLAESGSIFVQISDENVHFVRCLLDEVFGSENFVSAIAWTRGDMTSSTSLFHEKNLPVAVPNGLLVSEHIDRIMAHAHNGDLGDIKLIEIQCTNWDIINAGIHWLNFVVNLVNEPFDHVLAACDKTTRTYRDGMQVETLSVTTAQTKSGIRIVMHIGDHVTVNGDGGVVFRILGTDGRHRILRLEVGLSHSQRRSPQR